MIRNLIKVWHETLFYLNKKDVIEVMSDLEVKLEPVTMGNIDLVKNLRGKEYVKQFSKQLEYGDFGYYACVDNKPVAYGWVKHSGSKDYFFEISDGCCYLCRFFTHEKVRGHNIYPLLIGALIEHEKTCENFYIDIESGNTVSENGLKKVGFKKVEELNFLRVFKKTINKFVLKELMIK